MHTDSKPGICQWEGTAKSPSEREAHGLRAWRGKTLFRGETPSKSARLIADESLFSVYIGNHPCCNQVAGLAREARCTANSVSDIRRDASR